MLGFVAMATGQDLKYESKEVDDLKWEDIDTAVALLREGSIGQRHLMAVIDQFSDA